MPPDGFLHPDPQTFNTMVWKIVRQIPPGKVATYGQIAAFIPPPEGMEAADSTAYGARWVGSAMAACPADVPWQRVINAQGKISLRKAAEVQRRLLEAEGVSFDRRQRVDLERYGWAGPPAEWLQANGLLSSQQQYRQSSLPFNS